MQTSLLNELLLGTGLTPSHGGHGCSQVEPHSSHLNLRPLENSASPRPGRHLRATGTPLASRATLWGPGTEQALLQRDALARLPFRGLLVGWAVGGPFLGAVHGVLLGKPSSPRG